MALSYIISEIVNLE